MDDRRQSLALALRRCDAHDVISIEDYLCFVDEALDGIAEVLLALSDDTANARPTFPGANSPYAIATHCLGVMEHWGGARAAGRTIERDRPAEFTATGSVDDLVQRISAAKDQLHRDVASLDPAALPCSEPDIQDVGHPMEASEGGVLMHIYEELAQHHGQLEITRDLLQSRGHH